MKPGVATPKKDTHQRRQIDGVISYNLKPQCLTVQALNEWKRKKQDVAYMDCEVFCETCGRWINHHDFKHVRGEVYACSKGHELNIQTGFNAR